MVKPITRRKSIGTGSIAVDVVMRSTMCTVSAISRRIAGGDARWPPFPARDGLRRARVAPQAGRGRYWRVKVSVPSSTAGAWHDSLVVHVPSRVVWLKDVTVTEIAQSALPK